LPGNVRLPLRVLNRRTGVVTTVGLDEYLYGVVPLEVSRAWPPAMLAAQAIVARTYAVSRRSSARRYDVVDDESDQRYGGSAVATPATNAAVDATSGQIITFIGAAASVFYMACCGGHTEDAGELWGRNLLPYLRGVVDPWCAGTPDYRWRETMLAHEFLNALGPDAASIGSLLAVSTADLDPSGRPRKVVVRGSARSVELAVGELRHALGARVLPSTFIRQIALDPQGGVVIDGAGRGHGVGLCQWGARTMAQQGHDAGSIVRFYFPGTVIARA
jgi:stage II sporulation protein D